MPARKMNELSMHMSHFLPVWPALQVQCPVELHVVPSAPALQPHSVDLEDQRTHNAEKQTSDIRGESKE